MVFLDTKMSISPLGLVLENCPPAGAPEIFGSVSHYDVFSNFRRSLKAGHAVQKIQFRLDARRNWEFNWEILEKN